jgi:transposase
MGRNTERGRLTPEERSQIIERYNEGDHTYQSIADEFGVHKSTVARILKRPKPIVSTLETTATPQQPITTNDDGEVEVDPVLFRQYKLWEISQDIEATRQRGSHHALPQFHRLHLQVHDEWVQLKKEMEEFDGMTNPDEVLHQIAIAVQGLPPILRERLELMLSGDPQIIHLNRGGQ